MLMVTGSDSNYKIQAQKTRISLASYFSEEMVIIKKSYKNTDNGWKEEELVVTDVESALISWCHTVIESRHKNEQLTCEYLEGSMAAKCCMSNKCGMEQKNQQLMPSLIYCVWYTCIRKGHETNISEKRSQKSKYNCSYCWKICSINNDK
jgi:hypothetical protein